MRLLTNLFCKVALSSMIVTAPAMITGNYKETNYGKKASMRETVPYFSSAVIKKFVNYSNLTASPLFPEEKMGINRARSMDPSVNKTKSMDSKAMDSKADEAEGETAVKDHSSETLTVAASRAEVKMAEVSMVVNEAILIYNDMDLERVGLEEKAFEYAWRGYHNLVKKGLIRKKNILSICDFSQSSSSKRMYVIDVRRKKLLYRTYVAHGQNSGAEYASSFSNEPESFKSSLGFYVTNRTYYGHNGLSLKMDGVDSGYNDLAGKRNIVLHGSSYVGLKYLHNYGALGTSLGCPALPNTISPRIIRAVKNGSCIFIYHPTKKYLEGSSVING